MGLSERLFSMKKAEELDIDGVIDKCLEAKGAKPGKLCAWPMAPRPGAYKRMINIGEWQAGLSLGSALFGSM